MPTIGCKSCGRRQKRNLKEEVVIFEPQPKYIINPVNNIPSTGTQFDWKSMSKMV